MSIESTNKLLKKYENNNYVPGEKRTRDQEKIHKQKQLKREKHELVDELLNETKVLLLSNHDKEHVHYLVNKFDDFNNLIVDGSGNTAFSAPFANNTVDCINLAGLAVL